MKLKDSTRSAERYSPHVMTSVTQQTMCRVSRFAEPRPRLCPCWPGGPNRDPPFLSSAATALISEM